MIGTLNQVDWAEQIKARVSVEFDRVAKALASAASKQAERHRWRPGPDLNPRR